MKRINQYKKLFNVEKEIDLSDIKKTYRTLVKEWHPDKFQEGDPLFEEAKLKSKEIIDAYHFLVSIAPETQQLTIEEYTNTITEIGLEDFKHKGQLLEVTFADGSKYEYFGVTKAIFQKLINADNQLRFARRNIFNTYLYRKTLKAQLQEA